MAYIGNPPAPQNITSSEITDGTIVNVDIASNAAIAATKIAGLATVATTGAYSDVTGTPTLATVATTGAYSDLSGTPSLVASLADLGVTASAADLNTTDVTTLGTVEASKVVTAGGLGNVNFPDNAKAQFGTATDLQIYHSGASSYIKDEGTGQLSISTNGTDVRLTASSGDRMLLAKPTAEVELYYNGSQKLETTSTGIDVTGNATFGDNGKAIFGAGSDLQIYHDGGNSVIADNGTGNLLVYASTDLILQQSGSANRYADFAQNGAARIYNSGNVKFTTTSVGADVTGELIADSYNETYAAVTSTSNATTVDCEAGNSFSHTLTENTTFTFTNPPASGTAYSFSIEIIQDSGASGHTVTWPSSVDWPSATAPTLTATASAKDIFVFTTRDGGTNWYGFTAGQALA